MTALRPCEPCHRWLSADWSAVPAPVPYANLTNPQTLNLYAMVRDNPETFADLDGHQLDCSGNKAQGIGCQYALNWNSEHGIAQQQANAAQQAQQQSPSDARKLKFKTVSRGSHSWRVRWGLTHKSEHGGWIVQHITAHIPAHDGENATTYNYWEAWQVPANSRFTTIFSQIGYDDEFNAPSGSTAIAETRFYEGLTLPSSFVPNNPDTAAGILRSTTVDSHLPTDNATAPNTRWWGSE